MKLTDFLLARFAEDETVAQAATAGPWEVRPYWFTSNGRSWATVPEVIDEEIDAEDGVHIARWDPARVLAECEAKRRIVELHGDQVTPEGGPYFSPEIRLLALPYADHPDYREEWRP